MPEINPDDFLKKSDILYTTRETQVPDYEKILALSDEDFTRLHLLKMIVYQEKNGWWGKGKIPECRECKEVIERPRDLVRYCGQTLHHKCFPAARKKEEVERNITIRKYWDRFEKVLCSDISSS